MQVRVHRESVCAWIWLLCALFMGWRRSDSSFLVLFPFFFVFFWINGSDSQRSASQHGQPTLDVQLSAAPNSSFHLHAPRSALPSVGLAANTPFLDGKILSIIPTLPSSVARCATLLASIPAPTLPHPGFISSVNVGKQQHPDQLVFYPLSSPTLLGLHIPFPLLDSTL